MKNVHEIEESSNEIKQSPNPTILYRSKSNTLEIEFAHPKNQASGGVRRDWHELIIITTISYLINCMRS